MVLESREAEAGEQQPAVNTIGKYRVIGTLGRGSMGVVYKARDPEIGRVVAIKTLRKISAGQFDDDKTALERFRTEARSAGNLRHPNIITVFDVNIENDIPYIVMDYVEGESLDVVLDQYKRLRPDLVLFYLKQVAAGLDAAHAQGVIHRDVKPSNIIVDKAENCYIVDFGVASINESISESEDKQKSGTVMGTPGYMSPEQILNKRLTYKTDLFSFAAVAFECFTGKRPFPGDNFSEVFTNILNAEPLSLTSLVDLPLALEAELNKALSKDPAARFNSGDELVKAFSSALGLHRIEKPVLSAVPGEERGVALEGDQEQWTSLGGDSKEAAPSGQRAEELSKVPNVPIVAEEEGREDKPSWQAAQEDAYLKGDWGQDGLSGDMCPVPGQMFAHVKTPIGVPEGKVAIRRFSLKRLATAFCLLFCVGIVISIVWKTSGGGGMTGMPNPQPPIDLVEPIVQPQQYAALPSLEALIDPVPEGKAISEMSDRELLGVLASDDSSDDRILEALKEASSRYIPELVELSPKLLHHDSYLVRTEIIRALRDLGDRRCVPLLVESLNDFDPLVRGTAANALGHLGSRKALGYLSLSYTREDVPEVKVAMKRAIEKINGYPLSE